MEESEPNKKSKFRAFTFFAGLINVLTGIALLFLSVLVLVVGFQSMTENGDLATLFMFLFGLFIIPLLLALFVFAGGVVVIVMGSLQMKRGFFSNEKFYRRRNSAIGFIVFEGIVALVLLLAILGTQGAETTFPGFESVGVIALIIMIVMLVSIAFKIVDQIIFGVKIKKGKIVINLTKPGAVNNVAAAPVKEINVEEELKKIDELREKGLVSKEEHQKMRTDLLANVTAKK